MASTENPVSTPEQATPAVATQAAPAAAPASAARERRAAAAAALAPADAPVAAPAAAAPVAPAAPKKPVVLALDLGWGYTKMSRRTADGNGIEYLAFPSLAPRASALELTSSILGKRDTRIVTVDGISYEVGVDSGDLDSNETSRNLNNSFIFTEQYKAVFYGALSYMEEPVIDVLVVGLPLNNMQLAPKLKALMEGEHRINESTTVTVKEALVVPQPLGGLHYCLSLAKPDTPYEFLAEENNLIIDPGFLTFDFLFASGKTVVENRSGACPGGVSKVLMALALSISRKHGITYENLTAIDRGLRRRRIKINGADEELESHIKNTKDVFENTVNFMKNRVGDGSDIDNIILLGGGSTLFARTIKAFYPKHTPLVIENAQMANVMGFQAAGEAHVARKR